jgi:hypothetical protein
MCTLFGLAVQAGGTTAPSITLMEQGPSCGTAQDKSDKETVGPVTSLQCARPSEEGEPGRLSST